MNVFVLGTGRCGTVTMSKACSHARNFTAGHESRISAVGDARFAYPPKHIEVDSRLSWFLGDLLARYQDAFYVHLFRDPHAVAASITRRWGGRRGFANSFGQAMVLGGDRYATRLEIAHFQISTMTANINLALGTLPEDQRMRVKLERSAEWFPDFWHRIGAVGNLVKAQAEWSIKYNASKDKQ